MSAVRPAAQPCLYACACLLSPQILYAAVRHRCASSDSAPVTPHLRHQTRSKRTMVVPAAVALDAAYGRYNAVRAWLDNSPPNAVNDVDARGKTLLFHCCMTYDSAASGKLVYTDETYQLARYLLSIGADASRGELGSNATPLHVVATRGHENSLPIASLLICAKADLNAVETKYGKTPLAWAIDTLYNDGREASTEGNNKGPLDVIVCFLRGGVSLDSVTAFGQSIEGYMQYAETMLVGPELREDLHWIACKEMVAGVRKYGSWKAYRRAPHKSIIRLRSLFVRGRAKTADRRLARIANLPNGPCWKVLAFWRAAD